VRINITMDEALLKRVDAAAEREGFTRSGFLADAARRSLAEGARAYVAERPKEAGRVDHNRERRAHRRVHPARRTGGKKPWCRHGDAKKSEREVDALECSVGLARSDGILRLTSILPCAACLC
jgi:hypothetical protein